MPTAGPLPVHSPTSIASSPPISSSLPLPKSLRGNRSFANIARLIGIGGGNSETEDSRAADNALQDSADGENDDGDGEGEADDDDTESESEDAHQIEMRAQDALLQHQPMLAQEYYTLAALPPHRSSRACLSLGNLIARGEALADPDDPSAPHNQRRPSITPSMRKQSVDSATGSNSSPPSKWLSFFRSPTVSQSPPSTTHQPIKTNTSPEMEQGHSFIHSQHQPSGWALPKEGKRVVRDLEKMGKAGGWFVLGIGWVVDEELARQARVDDRRSIASQAVAQAQAQPSSQHPDDEDDAPIVFDSRGKGKAARTPLSGSVAELPPKVDASPQTSVEAAAEQPTATQSSSTGESTVLKTPESQSQDGDEEFDIRFDAHEYENRLKLFIDLFKPLLSLYRHGHIQSLDPVSLPPISSTDLPVCLRPQGDQEKGRNVFALGAVVAALVVNLHLLEDGFCCEETGLTSAYRHSVIIMANYVLGVTARPHLAAPYFRAVLENGSSGRAEETELVRQASKRLDIALQTPEPAEPIVEAQTHYPFPVRPMSKIDATIPESKADAGPEAGPSEGTPKTQNHVRPKAGTTAPVKSSHARQASGASIMSFMSFKGNALPSAKSTTSLASLLFDEHDSIDRSIRTPGTPDALASLRRLQNRDETTRKRSALPSFSPAPAAESLEEAQGFTFTEGPHSVLGQSRRQLVKPHRDALSAQRQPFWPSLSSWTMRSATRSTAPSFTPVEEDSASQGTVTPPAAAEPAGPVPPRKFSTEVIRAQPALVPANSYRPNVPAAPTVIPSSLRTIASSPQLSLSQSGANGFNAGPSMSSFAKSKEHASTATLRRLPFEPEEKDRIAPIDPTLAAAELASTLTKHVTCSVCGANGVNFPECRKCGLVFCSRSCRVDEKKAGNGKRHICGAWESRRLLQVPPATPSRPRRMSTVRAASNSPVTGSPQAAPRVMAH